MAGQRRRPWFQFHLSTAIWLMFVAGILLAANFEPRPDTWSAATARGWPFAAHYSPTEFDLRSGFNRPGAAGNLAVALLFLGASAVVLEWHTRSEKKPWFAVCVGVLCGAAPAVLVLHGYGAYFRYGAWFVILPVAACFCGSLLAAGRAVHSRWPLGKRALPTAAAAAALNRNVLFASLLCTLVFFGAWFGASLARKAYCQRICRKAEPVIAALEEYCSTHRQFPNRLEDLPDWDGLRSRTGLVIRMSKCSESGGLDVGRLDEADMTIYPKHGLWVVPIERMVVMSFTRFRVYVRDAGDKAWKEQSILWYLQATK